MRTLYIDVYFLINFTVDILSLYFAASFSSVPTSKKRILIAALLASVFAIIDVLYIDNSLLKLLFSLMCLMCISFVSTGRISIIRKIRMALSFLIFSALVGGGVNFLWGIFDKYINSNIGESSSGYGVNRKLLIIAIVIFLSIGVFKLLVAFFGKSYSAGGTVQIEISYFEKNIKVEAFIDTGNLAFDPMDASPIVFLKRNMADMLLPKEMIELRDPDMLSKKDRKRIRLIPISANGKTAVVTGFKADCVKVWHDKKSELIRATIAIDKEGGSYGGYFALISAAALNNVVT